MSVPAIPQTPPQAGRAAVQTTRDYVEADDRGYGWVVFSGVLLFVLGTLYFIEGLAAIRSRPMQSTTHPQVLWLPAMSWVLATKKWALPLAPRR
jgi:hypothetical protein